MALENNTEAPDFELSNQFGELIRLSSFRGKKPVALVFYPAAFTGTCTTELCELRDNIALFKSSEVELMAISVDSKASLRVFAEHEGYDFTLLADFWPHGGVAREYGVFVEEKGTASRATFLIDLDGIIRASIVAAPGQARPFSEYETAVRELVPVSS